MTQDGNPVGANRFTIGRVMGGSLGVLGRNFAPFVLLSIICSIPSLLIVGLNPQLQILISGDIHAAPPPQAFDAERIYLTVIGWIVSLLSHALNQSALAYGTFQDLQGRRVGFGTILSQGFAALLPVIGAAILMTLGLTVGFALLIVPGFVLLVMWWVTIPVIVVERADITTAFGRSRELTSGRRWAVFGLFVLYAVAQQLITWVAAAVFGGIFGMSGNFAHAILAGALAAVAVGILFSAYFAVMTAVGYYHLRSEKEGIVIDDIARVFD
jgi:hypothetical protein